MIQRDGVQLRLLQPKIIYSTSTGNRIEIPHISQQRDLDQLPEPRYYTTENENQGFISIYFILDIDYSPLIDRELRKRGQQKHPRHQHQVSNRKRPHPEHQKEEQCRRTTARTDFISFLPARTHQRSHIPPQQHQLMLTRTNGSKQDHGPKTMVTLHHRKPVFSRLGPKEPQARTDSKNPDYRREQYQKSKMRRQRRRQQAALAIRTF